MNERIEKAMYDAGLTAQGCWDEMDSYDQAAIMKFAELIVTECAELFNGNEKSELGYRIGDRIYRHFGVK